MLYYCHSQQLRQTDGAREIKPVIDYIEREDGKCLITLMTPSRHSTKPMWVNHHYPVYGLSDSTAYSGEIIVSKPTAEAIRRIGYFTEYIPGVYRIPELPGISIHAVRNSEPIYTAYTPVPKPAGNLWRWSDEGWVKKHRGEATLEKLDRQFHRTHHWDDNTNSYVLNDRRS